MTWADDDIFSSQGMLHGVANPGFRLSLLLPYDAGHPYRHTEAYEALFAIFAPILQERCDRVYMWDRPGAKARRSKKILPADWTPFRHIRSVYADQADGIFTGFYFVDKHDARGDGAGPCSFRFFVGRAIRLDVVVPLADWQAGRVSIDALVAALQALPYFSFIAGYGLALSETYSHGDTQDIYNALYRYGLRFPVVDLVTDEARSRSSDDDGSGVPELGLAGINWLTGVGTRFLHAGAASIVQGLPPAIGLNQGPNGIVFRAGEGPISGEAGADDATLPLYSALGARLSRLWRPNEDMPRPPVFGEFLPRESLAWEQRFFEPVA